MNRAAFQSPNEDRPAGTGAIAQVHDAPDEYSGHGPDGYEYQQTPTDESRQHLAQAWNTRDNLGLVVGATHPEALASLRTLAPALWFLANQNLENVFQRNVH